MKDRRSSSMRKGYDTGRERQRGVTFAATARRRLAGTAGPVRMEVDAWEATRLTGRDLVDISQTLRAGLPGWPGDTPFESEATWSHGPDCPVRVSRYTASTHAGTHADAPLHYDPSGAAIDGVALDAFIGPARVLDLRGCGGVVTPELAAAASDGPPRVLFRTYRQFPHEAWRETFAILAADTVRLLGEWGAVLLGIDSPSIDPQEAKVLLAHQAARAAGLRILEGLVLDGVEAGDYELIALPIRLGGLDAAPVRAVLRPLA